MFLPAAATLKNIHSTLHGLSVNDVYGWEMKGKIYEKKGRFQSTLTIK